MDVVANWWWFNFATKSALTLVLIALWKRTGKDQNYGNPFRWAHRDSANAINSYGNGGSEKGVVRPICHCECMTIVNHSTE